MPFLVAFRLCKWHSGYATGVYGAGSIRTVAHNPNAIRFYHKVETFFW